MRKVKTKVEQTMERNVWLVGLGWFSTSALLSTYGNTTFLNVFDSAFYLTLVRFIGSALLGWVANLLDGSTERLTLDDVGTIWRAFLVPSLLLLSANYANSVALNLSGITLTYVVKSSIPVVTVLINAFQGIFFESDVYATIVPTVLGIMLAAWSDMDFSVLGLMAALGSTLCQTFLNIQSKKAIEETRISGVKAQFVMVSTCSAVLVIPALHTLLTSMDDVSKGMTEIFQDESKMFVIFIAALAYHLEYVLNFIFTSLVSPLAFSIADIARRLSIIATGTILFNKTLTTLNVIGIGISFAGILAYALVDQKSKEKQTHWR